MKRSTNKIYQKDDQECWNKESNKNEKKNSYDTIFTSADYKIKCNSLDEDANQIKNTLFQYRDSIYYSLLYYQKIIYLLKAILCLIQSQQSHQLKKNAFNKIKCFANYLNDKELSQQEILNVKVLIQEKEKLNKQLIKKIEDKIQQQEKQQQEFLKCLKIQFDEDQRLQQKTILKFEKIIQKKLSQKYLFSFCKIAEKRHLAVQKQNLQKKQFSILKIIQFCQKRNFANNYSFRLIMKTVFKKYEQNFLKKAQQNVYKLNLEIKKLKQQKLLFQLLDQLKIVQKRKALQCIQKFSLNKAVVQIIRDIFKKMLLCKAGKVVIAFRKIQYLPCCACGCRGAHQKFKKKRTFQNKINNYIQSTLKNNFKCFIYELNSLKQAKREVMLKLLKRQDLPCKKFYDKWLKIVQDERSGKKFRYLLKSFEMIKNLIQNHKLGNLDPLKMKTSNKEQLLQSKKNPQKPSWNKIKYIKLEK